MKEHASLQELMEEYENYLKCEKDYRDANEMLKSETDPDMREMLKEELLSSKEKMDESVEKLKILMLPKDENDSKNVILEIRGGAG